jgi:hypothetical protein
METNAVGKALRSCSTSGCAVGQATPLIAMNFFTITPFLAQALANLSSEIAVFSAIFTVFGGICAGVWAVVVWRREATWRREDREAELKQRKEELRWKQAELARQLLDDIFDFAPSRNAWDMVDGITEFKNDADQEIEVNEGDIKRALELTMVEGQLALRNSHDEKARREEKFIRDCFDALFYYIERLERSLRIKVVHFDDLSAPSGYYINLMAARKMLFKRYAEFIGFDGAIAFMERFPEWREKKA